MEGTERRWGRSGMVVRAEDGVSVVGGGDGGAVGKWWVGLVIVEGC